MDDIAGLPLPISGETRLYAILGDPIAQVGSPRLFNTAFRRRGAFAVLVPMHVAPADLVTFIAAFRAGRNFDGLVITVPHKIAVMDLIDEVGPSARRIGAVNAIRKTDAGHLSGDNFDGSGFIRGLANRGHHVRGRRTLVIGAGGAGSAVAHAIAGEKPAALRLFDTDPQRVEYLMQSLRAVHPELSVESGAPDPEGFNCVVNCTSVGMKADDPLPVAVERLGPSALVIDIILRPATTRLIERAAERGCAVHRGTHMLEGQVDEICEFFGIEGQGAE